MPPRRFALCQLARSHGYEPRADGYVAKCHLCVDVRTHLLPWDDAGELQPRAFYANR